MTPISYTKELMILHVHVQHRDYQHGKLEVFNCQLFYFPDPIIDVL